MKLVLTDHAKSRLKQIVVYYNDHASVAVSENIKTAVFNRLKLLRSYPNIGQKEANLSDFRLDHRYLVEGNYKIIYRIDRDSIFITDIFDTRQDPAKQNP